MSIVKLVDGFGVSNCLSVSMSRYSSFMETVESVFASYSLQIVGDCYNILSFSRGKDNSICEQ